MFKKGLGKNAGVNKEQQRQYDDIPASVGSASVRHLVCQLESVCLDLGIVYSSLASARLSLAKQVLIFVPE